MAGKKKSIYSFNENEFGLKRASFALYINCIKALLRWGFNHDLLEQNYLEKNRVEVSNSNNKRHRPALDCEHFSSLVHAQKMHRKFIACLIRNLKHQNKQEHIILWLIHCVLCTRRSETIRVIKQYTKNATSVRIKTKCHDDFEVPIIKEVGLLIEQIQPWILRTTERTAAEYILRCIPSKYRKQMCAHGTRAFFRTVIEFMNLKNISDSAREYYLSHFSNSNTYSSYMRGDQMRQRIKIQTVWAEWISKTLPKEYRMLLTPLEPKV